MLWLNDGESMFEGNVEMNNFEGGIELKNGTDMIM